MIYHNYDRVLGERRGFVDYKLIQKALKVMNEASPHEKKALRDAVIYSVNNQINDSSNVVDLRMAAISLRTVKEHRLILKTSSADMAAFDQELDQLGQDFIRKNKARIKQYFPPDVDFLRLSQGELESHLGFEGIKAELELAKEEYEATQRMAQKLQVLLERDFSNWSVLSETQL